MKIIFFLSFVIQIFSCNFFNEECKCNSSNSYIVYQDSIHTIYHKSIEKGVGSESYYVIKNLFKKCSILKKQYPYTFFYKGQIYYCDYFNGNVSSLGVNIEVYIKDSIKVYRRDTNNLPKVKTEGVYKNKDYYCKLSDIESYEDLPVGKYYISPPSILYIKKESIGSKF